MRGALAILLLSAGLLGVARVQDPAPHVVKVDSLSHHGEGASAGRTTEAQLMQHLLDMAKRLPAKTVAARGAVADLAYPRDSAENASMDGYALLLVTAVSRDPRELPLAAVKMKIPDGEVTLPRVGRRAGTVTDPQVLRLFGKHRSGELFYFPVTFTRLPCSVLVDFAANRTNLEVLRFPLAPEVDAWPKELPILDPGTPDSVAAASLARREFGWGQAP